MHARLIDFEFIVEMRAIARIPFGRKSRRELIRFSFFDFLQAKLLETSQAWLGASTSASIAGTYKHIDLTKKANFDYFFSLS